MKPKRQKYLQIRCIRIIAAAFFALTAGLTGCASREARFLEDAEMLQADNISPTESASWGQTTEDAPKENTQDETEVLPTEDIQPIQIYVDVCGAVTKPGVYCLPEGSRIFQAIEEAGGFAPEADENYINRAGVLSDGQQIYVPTREEVQESSLPLQAQPGGGQPLDTADTKVNINTADESQLTTLTGIGATRAQAIIAYRQEHGAFSAVEEIMNVQGIKEGTFEKIKEDIVV